MSVGKLAVLIPIGLMCLIGGAQAQFDEGGKTPDQARVGQPPDAEFHMGRLAYAARGCAGSRGWCNPWWAIDYPLAEAHFLPALARMTRTQVAEDSRAVTLDDDALFDYPWIILQQPGRGAWHPHGAQAARLREYLRRGGFMMVDDFHGENEWLSFLFAMQEVLPDRPIVDIPDGDPLLGIVFELDKKVQIPGDRHVRYGGMRMEGPPHWRGIYDEHGRLMVAIGHNSDMGDGWEHADDPGYPTDKTAMAYRFGVNYVIYAMTH